jgi:hypothetical protein
VPLGDTFPTDFGSAFEGGNLMRHLDEWAARGPARARFMSPDDVASTLLSVAATLTDLPGIGVDHLTIRSPSPVTASFTDAFAGVGETTETTDPA